MVSHPTHSLISKNFEYRLVRLSTMADVTALGTIRIRIGNEEVPSIIEINEGSWELLVLP